MSERDINILLIPEHIETPERLEHLLSSRGYRIDRAATAAELRIKCRRHDFDLIITGSPGGQSDEAFPSNAYPPGIPVINLGPGSIATRTAAPIIWQCPSGCDEPGFFNLLDACTRVRVLFREAELRQQELADVRRQLTQQERSMQQHHDFLEVLARRDGLTGLFNRHHLNKILDEEFGSSADRETDLCLLMLDIDYFGRLNRTLGRSFGDFVLNDFAARLTRSTLPLGMCFRFSGEVFACLLRDTGLDDTLEHAEAIRRELAEKPFVRGNTRCVLTISAGAVSLVTHRPEAPDDFITMAERALFTAKSEGRNRVAAYRPLEHPSGSASQKCEILLRETVAGILDKTKSAAIDALQLAARDMTGAEDHPHILAIKRYTELLGDRLNLPGPVVETFRNAISLHAAIRLLLHREMVGKDAALGAEERDSLRDLPFELAELTELFDIFANERAIFLHHGERFDGSGYPEGLRGEEIPLSARLFSLVDAVAAMTSDRLHRPPLAPDDVVERLVLGAGTRFDPELVVHLLAIISEHRLLDLDGASLETAVQTVRRTVHEGSP